MKSIVLKNPTVQVSLLAFVNLLLGFGSQVVLAALFGASKDLDSYVASTTIPFLLLTVFSSSLSYALVPQFVDIRTTSSETIAHRFLAAVLMLVGVLFVLLALILSIGAPLIVSWTTPGFTGIQRLLTEKLLRIQSLSLCFSSLATVLISYHHSRKNFILIGVAPLLPSIGTISLVLVFHGSIGITSVAYGLLAGTILQTVSLYPRKIALARMIFPIPRETIRLFFFKVLPLIGGSIYYKTDMLLDRFLLSFAGPGTIAHLWYSRKIVDASLSLSTVGIATTSFPTFSEYASRGQSEDFEEAVYRQSMLLGLIVFPLSAFLAFFGLPLVMTLLQRGAFQTSDSASVTPLLIGQLGVLIGGSFGTIFSNTFYALQDTRTPTIVGAIGYTLGVGLKIGGFFLWGVFGIAVATSLYTVLNALAEYVILRRRTLRTMRKLEKNLAVLGVISLVSGGAVSLIVSVIPLEAFPTILVSGLVFLFCYGTLCLVFRVEAIVWVRQAIGKRKNP